MFLGGALAGRRRGRARGAQLLSDLIERGLDVSRMRL
jgi:hypothetical protein